MEFKLAEMFVNEEIWIEAISNEIITWNGTDGWNFHYRISGVSQCDWYIFLYNPKYKQFYYRDSIIEGKCESVELRIRYKISRNAFMYNLFPVDTLSTSPPIPTTTPPGYYPYFCEPSDKFDKVNLFKSFPCTYAGEFDSRFDDRVLSDRGSVVLNVPPSSIRFNCSHPSRMTLSTILIHSHDEKIKFEVYSATTKSLICSLCDMKNYLGQNGYAGHQVILDSKLSEYVLNQ